MKIQIKKMLLVIPMITQSALGGPLVIPPLAETNEGKDKYAEVTKFTAKGDIPSLIKSLPQIEMLWKEDPKGYFHAMATSIRHLVRSKDSEAVKAAIAAFPGIIEKKCPVDADLALYYFSLKNEIMGCYLDIASFKESGDYYLAIADFLNEIRSKRIPDYQKKSKNLKTSEILEAAGVKRDQVILPELRKEIISKAVKDNQENEYMDRLQDAILTLERGIIDSLIVCAPSVKLENDKKRSFFIELANRAKLTAEEKKRLEVPK
jgi:hypothetical protein